MERKSDDLGDSPLSRSVSDPAFLAAVCHDLRGPLGAIGTWIHVLSSGRADAATQQQALGAMQRDVSAQGRLIERLGVLSSILAGTPAVIEEVDLVSLLGELGHPSPASSVPVLADARLLRQLLAILVPAAGDLPADSRHPTLQIEREQQGTVSIRGTCRKGASGLVDATVARAVAEVQGGHLALLSASDGTAFVLDLAAPPLAAVDSTG